MTPALLVIFMHTKLQYKRGQYSNDAQNNSPLRWDIIINLWLISKLFISGTIYTLKTKLDFAFRVNGLFADKLFGLLRSCGFLGQY